VLIILILDRPPASVLVLPLVLLLLDLSVDKLLYFVCERLDFASDLFEVLSFGGIGRDGGEVGSPRGY
jgi:hypothetical protein